MATINSWNSSYPAGVASGGIGDSSLTSYTVLCAGTTSTGPIQEVSGVGTLGQLLVSQGAGALPAWTDASSASKITITGDTGGSITSSSFTFAGGTTGLSFGGSGTTETLTFAGITANAGIVNLGTDNANNAINIGLGTTARAIHIGDSAAAHVITIGSLTGAASITEHVGIGNYTLDGVAASTYTIGASTTTGTYTLGGTAQSGTMTLGSSSATNIVNVGTGEGATTVNIATGATHAKAVNIGTGAVANVLTFGTTTASSSVNINAPAGGVLVAGVATNAVSNKQYVTINTSTGALGSDAGPTASDWTVVTASTQQAVVNSGYFANYSGTLVITLPVLAAVGSFLEVAGMNNATGWKIAQNASQSISMVSVTTTVGTGGSLESTETYDSVRLVCNIANTSWVVVSSMGNITYV